MESARRWSGFVCPDCRFVFRVPRDHDGQGVVCPSCRRLLKIPQPGDRPPPLVVPLRTSVVEQEQQPTEEVRTGTSGNRRRKKRSRKTDDQSWDSSAVVSRRSGKGEKRQMFWMLVGGGAFFALILGFVLLAMLGGNKNDPAVVVTAAPVVILPAEPEAMSDVAFLTAAEPLTRKFFQAKNVDEMLPLVRNPDTAAPRMRGFYQEGKIKSVGMAEFNTTSFVTRMGSALCVQIRTVDFEDKFLAFFETADGLRIDWESWVGWSEMPWEAFMAAKPTTAHVFRVRLSSVDYYNMAFADEGKWQSFFLESPDSGQALYGYAEQGTALAASLKPTPDVKWIPLMLSLRYPPNATSQKLVIIEKIIAESWVEETIATP